MWYVRIRLQRWPCRLGAPHLRWVTTLIRLRRRLSAGRVGGLSRASAHRPCRWALCVECDDDRRRREPRVAGRRAKRAASTQGDPPILVATRVGKAIDGNVLLRPLDVAVAPGRCVVLRGE